MLGEEAAGVLLAMLTGRDPVAGEHARAVAQWARRLCTTLGVGEEGSAFAGLCGLLHDVGTISVPEAILKKAGELTGIETAIVRDHAAAGERILRGIPALECCADVVRSHHERWDGGGYPDGISGANIPFEARIVAVADAFAAMIGERPFRRPIPPRTALESLSLGRGSQWDPAAVDAMHAIFRHATPVRAPAGRLVPA